MQPAALQRGSGGEHEAQQDARGGEPRQGGGGGCTAAESSRP
jgi:hypothetical protein